MEGGDVSAHRPPRAPESRLSKENGVFVLGIDHITLDGVYQVEF